MSDDNHVDSVEGAQQVRLWARICMPIIVIGLTVFIVKVLQATKSEEKKRPPIVKPNKVTLLKVKKANEKLQLIAMGSVEAAQVVDLKARVGGELVTLVDGFRQGAHFDAGVEVASIDPTDYKIRIDRLKSVIAGYQADLKVELGQQAVARQELELMETKGLSEEEKALVLRQPQLAKIAAAIQGAEADLAQAVVNLKRTSITIPFNCVIDSENLEKGTQVSVQEKLARLIGTEEFQVVVTISVDRLKFLDLTQKSKAVVEMGTNGNKLQFEGEVTRLLSGLEKQGRMARLLITVKDPFNLNHPERKLPLLLDSYVTVRIDGKELINVIKLPREYLRDGDKVWVNKDNKLTFRLVKLAWSDAKFIYISAGLEGGEIIITSELSMPVEGMSLSVDKVAGQGGGK